jgi:hypothetical protein
LTPAASSKKSASAQDALVELQPQPGVMGYAFTFG